MRIEVFYRSTLDGRAEVLCDKLRSVAPNLSRVAIADVFLTDMEIPSATAAAIFSDPIAQRACVDSPMADNPAFAAWSQLIEIAYKPGVTDTLAITAREALVYEFGEEPVKGKVVQASTQYLLFSEEEIDKNALLKIQRKLHNPLIQNACSVSRDEWAQGTRPPALYPQVKIVAHDEVEKIDIASMADIDLIELSKNRLLALNLDEMQAIRNYFKAPERAAERASRNLGLQATDVEIEMIAQTWSEHCKHKIFNAQIEYSEGDTKETIKSLFKTYIKATTDVVAKEKNYLCSVFIDNSGVIRFDENTLVCIKAETHNSPSALDPYGGAITGIVGVNRDIMGTGKGAKPIFNTDVLCFGYPEMEESKIPEGLIHPKELLAGVHRGIVDGGNQSGIPTAAGAFLFDEGYTGKPLVFCGTGGVMPAKVNGEDSWIKHIRPGHKAVMIGGRIGKDGIHGATFSSLELNAASPVSAVQIGDPIIQRKMMDFLLEARDLGLYQGITDNGAGGLSSSLGEMAQESGGIRIDLDGCPLKYAGLAAWEILVSESQERMSLSVDSSSLKEFMELARRRNVEASVVGEFTNSGYIEIYSHHQTVGLLSMAFLHDGLPILHLKANWKRIESEIDLISSDRKLDEDLIACLSEPNVASKEFYVRQYDHEVQGMSVEKPFAGLAQDAPSDGAVLKLLPDSYRGLTVSHGICPRFSVYDTYRMAQNAVDEAYRAHIALGGDPDEVSGLDNFCWPDPVESVTTPDGAYKLAQLVRACRGLMDLCVEYGIPLVSGKDSMKNDATMGGKKLSIKPTLLVTLMGIIKDVRKACGTDFLEAGDLVYLLGETNGEMGGSIFERVSKLRLGPCPEVKPSVAMPLYRKLANAISGKLARSCHDISEGGLAVALAESCLGGRLGAQIAIDTIPGSSPGEAARFLFCESPSRFVASVRPEDRERFESTMRDSPFAMIGMVTERNRLDISFKKETVLELGLKDIEKAFKTPIVQG